MGWRLLATCLDQPVPHYTIVNLKPAHFGDRSGVGCNMTDLSPEHVSIVARTTRLQRFVRESNPPVPFGINRMIGCHES